jgi:hypothetical protein
MMQPDEILGATFSNPVEDELYLRVEEEWNKIVWLRDGEISAFTVHYPPGDSPRPSFCFIVRVISQNRSAAYTRPFATVVRNNWPHIVWKISNGQLVGLPVSEKALENNGVLEYWKE